MSVDMAALESELLDLGTATLYEASGLSCALPSSLHPVAAGMTLVGRVLPVATTAGDNLALHHAVERARPGDVLVVDAQGSQHGYWGEVLTVFAQSRGVRGLVIDGGARDVRELVKLGFPVFSTHIALSGTRKRDQGAIGAPIRLGSAVIERDDILVADADGIVVIPQLAFEAVLLRSRERAEKEQHFLAELRGGASTVDLYHLPRAN